MCSFSLRWGAAIAALFITVSGAPGDSYDDLLRGVTDRANMVCMANMRALQMSAMGSSRGWAEKRQRDYLGGLVHLPPTVSRVVIGQQLDTTTLHPTWRMALIDLTEPMTPAQVVRREKGTEDKVGGLPVVVSPRGQAFVFLSSKLIAQLDTGNRQEIARWIAFYNRSTRPTLTGYLQEAAENMRPGVQITVALDLADVLDLEGVRKRLEESKAMLGNEVSLDELARTVASLRGVTLSLEVDRDIKGEIRLDFAESAAPLKTIGKELLLHALQKMGARLEDLFSWKGTVEGKSYLFRGRLTESAARMLLAPVAGGTSPAPFADAPAPAPKGPGTAPGSEPEPPPANPEAVPSLKYFHSVTALLDELNKEKKPGNISQRGYWYEQYAGKIDALPILNVDQELLDYGAAISATLRGMANLGKIVKGQNAMIRQNQIDNVAVTVPVTRSAGGYVYGPYNGGGFGYSYTAPSTMMVSNWRTISTLCSRNAATEKVYRETTWKNIAEATQQIRRKMVDKYKVEF